MKNINNFTSAFRVLKCILSCKLNNWLTFIVTSTLHFNDKRVLKCVEKIIPFVIKELTVTLVACCLLHVVLNVVCCAYSNEKTCLWVKNSF